MTSFNLLTKHFLLGGVIIGLVGVFYFVVRDVSVPGNDSEGNEALSMVTAEFVNGYEIRHTRHFQMFKGNKYEEGAEIQILKDGTLLFKDKTEGLFAEFRAGGTGAFILNAGDLVEGGVINVNNNKSPDLVLVNYSGGMHCCFRNYVLELGPTLSTLLDLETGDFPIEFKDLNGDGVMEIETRDSVWGYWNTSFGASPAPRVALSLQRGKYEIDMALMYRPAPSEAELEEVASRITSWSGSHGPEVAWKYVVELVYSGNRAAAQKYVDFAWREDAPGDFGTKEDFWKEFETQIQKSNFILSI